MHNLKWFIEQKVSDYIKDLDLAFLDYNLNFIDWNKGIINLCNYKTGKTTILSLKTVLADIEGDF